MASFLAASLRSPSLTMLYRSKTERVLCPEILMSTRSGMHALTMFLTGRPSEIMEDHPGDPGLPEALRYALLKGTFWGDTPISQELLDHGDLGHTR